MFADNMPLIIFTLCQQLTIGAFVIIGTRLLLSNMHSPDNILVSKRFFFIMVVAGIGLIASTLHLGQPFKSINSLNRVGAAWLSNEVITVGALLASGGLFWLISMFKNELVMARKVLLIIAILSSLFLIVAMSLTYMLPTVPSWNSAYTPLTFILTAIILGSIASQLLIQNTSYDTQKFNLSLNILGIMTAVISIMVMGFHVHYLSETSSAINNALTQIPHYSTIIVIRMMISLILVAIWLLTLLKKIHINSALWILLALAILAEGSGRLLFLASHMTVGL